MRDKMCAILQHHKKTGILILVLLTIPLGLTAANADVGTTFTYQGQLLDGDGVVDDTCDIQFSLYNAADDGSQVGGTVTKTEVAVTDGLFTAELDFGAGAFGGAPRWLELTVRCPAGTGDYDVLSPRQSLAPTPYAMYATQAMQATTATTASGAEEGAITPTSLNGITINGASGQALGSDGSGGFVWQDAASGSVKQLVQSFVLAGGESVSVGDVVTFLDGEAHGPGGGWVGGSVFSAFETEWIDVGTLSDTDFVVAYRNNDNSNHGTAITGTISGGALSWGSASVFKTSDTRFARVSSLSTTDFVIAYQDQVDSKHGKAITGTVSGGSLIWGMESTFNADSTSDIALCAISATDFVVAYRDDGDLGHGTAITGTVSGGALSWGTESDFNGASTRYISCDALSATDFVVAYGDIDNSSYGTAITGTVSGATLAWGTESVFNAASTASPGVAALSATDFVVAYQDVGNGGYGTAIVGTVGGSGLSWGTESVYNPAHSSYNDVSLMSADEVVVAYRDNGNSGYGAASSGAVSRQTLNWEAASVFNGAETFDIAASPLSPNLFVVVYWDFGDSNDGMANVGIYGRRLIGTAKTAATGGEPVPVIFSGMSNVHTGLEPGQFYYLQGDGSLGTTVTATRIGLAISSTELILDQLW